MHQDDVKGASKQQQQQQQPSRKVDPLFTVYDPSCAKQQQQQHYDQLQLEVNSNDQTDASSDQTALLATSQSFLGANSNDVSCLFI